MTLCRRPSRSWGRGEGPGRQPGSLRQRVTRPSPTEPDPRLPKRRAPPSEPWARSSRGTKRPCSPRPTKGAPVPQIAWFLCPSTTGQRNHDPRIGPRSHPVVPFRPLRTKEPRLSVGVPRELCERREPWPLGSSPARSRPGARSAAPARGREARGRVPLGGVGCPSDEGFARPPEPSARPQLRDGLRQRVTPPLRADPRPSPTLAPPPATLNPTPACAARASSTLGAGRCRILWADTELDALGTGVDERAARQELRRQIGRLERELAALFGEAFGRVEIAHRVAPRPAEPRDPRPRRAGAAARRARRAGRRRPRHARRAGRGRDRQPASCWGGCWPTRPPTSGSPSPAPTSASPAAAPGTRDPGSARSGC